MKTQHASMLASGLAVAFVSLSLSCGLGLAGCSGSQPAPATEQAEQEAKEADEAQAAEPATSEKEESLPEEENASSKKSDKEAKTEAEEAAQKKEKAEATDKKKKSEEEAKPAVDPARVEALQTALQGAVDSAPMTVHTTVIDLTDGVTANVGGSEKIASASMIKVLIAHTFLEQVKAGKCSLDDTYVLKASDIVGGTGTLAGLGAGAEVTYRDIFMRMIDVSDNTGTNILIDAVGMDAVNATAKKLELKCTELNRRMMDYDAIGQGIENYTCADDLAKLFQMAYEGKFVDKASSELMMEALRHQTDRCGIINGLPEGTSFAHKTGTLATVRHDGGIVEGDHPFVIVVLCGGDGFYEAGAEASMADVSRAAYGALTQ